MSNLAIKGSLNAMAAQGNIGLAEAFLSADTIICVDTSGSMAQRDRVDDDKRTRYQRACDELVKLQGTLQGRIAVMSFSSTTLFCPDGKPLDQGGGTDLAGALEYVHIADGLVNRFIVISDGYPDDAQKALVVAKTFTSTIDCIYIGEPGSGGESFLKQLAQSRGGSASTLHGGVNIAAKCEVLMLGAPSI